MANDYFSGLNKYVTKLNNIELYDNKLDVNLIDSSSISTHVTAGDLNTIKDTLSTLVVNVNDINSHLISASFGDGSGYGTSSNSNSNIDNYLTDDFVRKNQLIVDNHTINDSIIKFDDYYLRHKNIFVDGYKISPTSPYNLVSYNQLNLTINGLTGSFNSFLNSIKEQLLNQINATDVKISHNYLYNFWTEVELSTDPNVETEIIVNGSTVSAVWDPQKGYFNYKRPDPDHPGEFIYERLWSVYDYGSDPVYYRYCTTDIFRPSAEYVRNDNFTIDVTPTLQDILNSSARRAFYLNRRIDTVDQHIDTNFGLITNNINDVYHHFQTVEINEWGYGVRLIGNGYKIFNKNDILDPSYREYKWFRVYNNNNSSTISSITTLYDPTYAENIIGYNYPCTATVTAIKLEEFQNLGIDGPGTEIDGTVYHFTKKFQDYFVHQDNWDFMVCAQGPTGGESISYQLTNEPINQGFLRGWMECGGQQRVYAYKDGKNIRFYPSAITFPIPFEVGQSLDIQLTIKRDNCQPFPYIVPVAVLNEDTYFFDIIGSSQGIDDDEYKIQELFSGYATINPLFVNGQWRDVYWYLNPDPQVTEREFFYYVIQNNGNAEIIRFNDWQAVTDGEGNKHYFTTKLYRSSPPPTGFFLLKWEAKGCYSINNILQYYYLQQDYDKIHDLYWVNRFTTNSHYSHIVRHEDPVLNVCTSDEDFKDVTTRDLVAHLYSNIFRYNIGQAIRQYQVNDGTWFIYKHPDGKWKDAKVIASDANNKATMFRLYQYNSQAPYQLDVDKTTLATYATNDGLRAERRIYFNPVNSTWWQRPRHSEGNSRSFVNVTNSVSQEQKDKAAAWVKSTGDDPNQFYWIPLSENWVPITYNSTAGTFDIDGNPNHYLKVAEVIENLQQPLATVLNDPVTYPFFSQLMSFITIKDKLGIMSGFVSSYDSDFVNRLSTTYVGTIYSYANVDCPDDVADYLSAAISAQWHADEIRNYRSAEASKDISSYFEAKNKVWIQKPDIWEYQKAGFENTEYYNANSVTYSKVPLLTGASEITAARLIIEGKWRNLYWNPGVLGFWYYNDSNVITYLSYSDGLLVKEGDQYYYHQYETFDDDRLRLRSKMTDHITGWYKYNNNGVLCTVTNFDDPVE